MTVLAPPAIAPTPAGNDDPGVPQRIAADPTASVWVTASAGTGKTKVLIDRVLNLLLAGFNLLPGLPLDGGAILQSLVWGASGRRDRGLVVAGWAGRVVAVGVFLWFGVRPAVTADLRALVEADLVGPPADRAQER